MEFGEMKRNTSNWSNFCIFLSRAGLSESAGFSCNNYCCLNVGHRPLSRLAVNFTARLSIFAAYLGLAAIFAAAVA